MNPLPTPTSAQPALFSGERLRELREAMELDIPSLAKRMALSPAQLRQLENNQSSLFYSEAIRVAAARKVAEFLGEPLLLDPAAVTCLDPWAPDRLPHLRVKLDPDDGFALSGWTAALWLVALTFAVLMGMQTLAAYKAAQAQAPGAVADLGASEFAVPVVSNSPASDERSVRRSP